jgi:hypothetical protein
VGTPVDINYGGKVSGRIGRWRIGMLAVRQDAFERASGAVIDASMLAVARISADVLAESSVGMIATSGDPSTNGSNSLIGADFLYLNSHFPGNRTLQGAAWFQKTSSSNVSGDDTAFGFGGGLEDNTGWRFGASMKQFGANFRPALGFVSRAGVRDFNADLGRTRLLRGGRLQTVFSGVDVNRIESLDGPLQSQSITVRALEVETTGRDKLNFFYAFNEERLTAPFTIYSNVYRSVVIPVGHYEFNEYGMEFVAGQQRRLGVRFNLSRGDFYDGERLFVGAELNWKQSRYLSLRAGYDFNDIDLSVGSFSTRILSAGVSVNFQTLVDQSPAIRQCLGDRRAAKPFALHPQGRPGAHLGDQSEPRRLRSRRQLSFTERRVRGQAQLHLPLLALH